MRKNKQMAQSRSFRRCQIKPLAERLEPRQLLAYSPNLDGSSESMLALQQDDQRIVPALLARSEMRAGPSGDYRIQSLNSTYKWGTSNLTYSFYAGGTYYGDDSSPTPVSEAVKANVRFIFNEIIAPVINMTFTEVTDTPTTYGLMRFLCTPSVSYAAAHYPWAGDTNTGGSTDVVGDVYLNPSSDVVGTEFNSRNNSFRSGPGSHGFTALAHEMGHALGLKHPFESPSALPVAEDNQDNTLMTYTFKGSSPATFMAYDLLTLQYFYGANTATRAGDTTYTFTTTDVFSTGGGSGGSSPTAFGSTKNTLWDAGGTDTLDLSTLPAMTGGYRIDIQPGGWITPTSAYNSVTYSGGSVTNSGTRLPLAGTTIENVKVTGSSDSIFLNTAANYISGYKTGASNGTDVIAGSNQADTLDLSQFFEASVGKSQVGNDLVLNLGGTTGTVTVKDYYAVAAVSRITILYKLSTVDVSIAATSADKAEGTAAGTTPFTFTVTRAGDLAAASSVFWAVTGSGASQASAADFVESVLPSGTVSFAANESTKTITVYVSADATVESDEGFTVTLSTPTGATLGTPASATGTIRNDDLPPPSIAIAAASADKAEGTGAGTTPFTFTATRSGDLSGASSVSWAVTGSGGSQAVAADFAGSVLPSGSVSFAANESTKTITVNVSADATVESDEGFTVNLSAPTGATLGSPASASGTIRNDDLPPPSFSIAAASAEKAEGTGGGTTPFTFTVTRGGDLAAASSVSWAVTGSGGNQAGAADFAGSVLPSGSASFAANESTKTITVNVVADASIESDEGFTVTLSNPSGATLGTPASATGTIRNDDFPPAPTVAIAAASAEKAEGTGGGATSFTFAVTRSGDLTVTSSVSWAVTGSGGNQAGAADFAGSVLPSGSVSFAAGESTKTITVSVSADSTVEADESFTITISAPNGATLGTPAFASGIIRNDDLPVLSIGDARITETDSGTVNAVLVVTLSGPAFVPVTVSYATFDRTATTAGSDYFNTTGTITFAPGETSKPITVSVQGDTKFESEETFGVRLSAANGGTIAKPEGLVTILNDDTRSRIAIAATDARRSEGNTGRMAFTFTVTRTGSLVGDVMLPWKLSGSGARPADRFDFIGGVLPTGTVWFAPGRQTATVTVNVLADRVAEFDEQFTVTLQDPKNGLDFLAVGGGSANGTILNDDGGVPRTLVSATIQAQAFAGSGVATMPSSKTITPQAFAAAGYSTVPATGVSAKKAQFPAMPRF